MPRRARRRPPSLKRGLHVREPEQRFFIYCEGAGTEPAYFRAIDHHYDRVQLHVRGIGADPLTVAQRAINDPLRGTPWASASSFEEQDQVWAVFDRNSHLAFAPALSACRHAGVRTAHSDPCFELWLVLHLEHYDRPAASIDVQRRLRLLYPAYDHQRTPGPEFLHLLKGLECAESRAQHQLRRRLKEDRPCGNPSTTVGCLTRAIGNAQRRAAHPSYSARTPPNRVR